MALKDGFNRHQRIQFERLRRADRLIHTRARRAIDRGEPLYRIFRHIRGGAVHALRALLCALGDKRAGAYSWGRLVDRCRVADIALSAQEQAALQTLAAMLYHPEEPGNWRGDRAQLQKYLGESGRHQRAGWAVLALSSKRVWPMLGVAEGSWYWYGEGRCVKLMDVWGGNGFFALVRTSRNVAGWFGADRELERIGIMDALVSGKLDTLPDGVSADDLDAYLVCPVDCRAPAPADPARAALFSVLSCTLARRRYAKQTWWEADPSSDGAPLILLREPDNPHDIDMVTVALKGGGDIIGCVPRDCNEDIARRLDAGEPLRAWLCVASDMTGDDSPPVTLDIRSPIANASSVGDNATSKVGDASSRPSAADRPHRCNDDALAKAYWPTRFAHNSLDNFRRCISLDRRRAIQELDSTLNWAREAWLIRCRSMPGMGGSWSILNAKFSRLAARDPFAFRLRQAEQELRWWAEAQRLDKRAQGDLVLAVMRLTALFHAEIPLLDERHRPQGGLSLVLSVPRPSAPSVPASPRALAYSPRERIRALRALRRLLEVKERVVCAMPAAITDLLPLRVLNRDRRLLRTVIRKILSGVCEVARQILKPDENGRCQELSEGTLARHPVLRPLIPNSGKWYCLMAAARLIERDDWQEHDLSRLADELRSLQPITRRRHVHGTRREIKDYALYAAERLLVAAVRLDIMDVVEATCVLLPVNRFDRLNPRELEHLYRILAAELFAVGHADLARAYPALLAHPTDLRYAVRLWQSGLSAPADVEAARRLLEDALVSHPGRLPRALLAGIDWAAVCPIASPMPE